jgi:signal transduction histidine kinase
MPLPIDSGHLVNDPAVAPRAAPWMLGITPLRLAVLAAVCILVAARPAYFAFGAATPIGEFVERWVVGSAYYFVYALPMFVLVIKVEAATARMPIGKRVAWLFVAVVAGALAFAALVHLGRIVNGNLRGGDPIGAWIRHAAMFSRAFWMGALLTAILVFAAREREAHERLHAAQLGRVDRGRQLAEVRLNLLQAQIEPHFLFNSLASVKRLYEREPERGRELLANLRAYLRAASTGGRGGDTTLEREIVLARSFLAIFQMRMGWRLRVTIDVPPALERALVPPLMIGTLVENAVKHGLSPRAKGGSVRISARDAGERLEIEVSDDGVGFRESSGHGVGLANTRARLHTLFGAAGEIELEENPRGGVTATLGMPLRFAAEAAA